MIKISIIIATKDRSNKIGDCIESIIKNSFKNWELIILDQSQDDLTNCEIKKQSSPRIIYKKLSFIGKSRALNLGIKLAKGQYVAFTDDDCIVDRDWLEKIVNYLNKNIEVVGVFGNVYPYESKKHLEEFCPATFIKRKHSVITDPRVVHYLEVGSGNNMSFRKSVFAKYGLFKEWLGPGKIVSTSEDGELIFRILHLGGKLGVSPFIKIWHNRWISADKLELLRQEYSKGFVAVFAYYLKKETFGLATNFIRYRIEERFFVLIKEKKIFRAVNEAWMVLKGMLCGLFYRMSDDLKKR